ncbi:MAG: hypothetical protein GC131_02315 [Alphaproteobacteria bacterium]|nr:hypothetical protein [Alphaproteobacteria bacterium]
MFAPYRSKIEVSVAPLQQAKTDGPPPVSDEAYFNLLCKLLEQGKTYTKKATIRAYPLLGEIFNTLNNEGSLELSKINARAKDLWLVFDGQLYSEREARKLFIKVFKKYGEEITKHRAQLNAGTLDVGVSVTGRGIWTVEHKTMRSDYQRVADSVCSFKVNPDTQRLCLDVDEPLTWRCTWGDFYVPAGGTLAVDPKHVPAIIEAMLSVSRGEKTIGDAFFEVNDEGKRVAKFDVYGMEARFR